MGTIKNVRGSVILVSVLALFLFLPFARAEGNLTVYANDEQSQVFTPFIISITNGTSTYKGGLFSTFDTETDTTGFWTPSSLEKACDYNTQTSATETCQNGGGCAAGTITIECLVSVPYFTVSSHSSKFVIHARANVASAAGTAAVQIYDESLGSYVNAVTGLNSPTVTGNASLDNINGRYGKDGTARVKLTTTGGGFANNEVMTVYDIWTTQDVGQQKLPTTEVNPGLVISATDNDQSGGLPLGTLTTEIVSNQYQTANDYAQRHYYFTITNESNTTLPAYLLLTSSGSTVLYTVLYAFQPLSDVLITAQRNINGSYLTVDQAVTDSAGLGSNFLQNGNSYSVIASKSGYGISTVNVNPSAGLSYTFNLQKAAAIGFQTLFADLSYMFVPNQATLQVVNTANNSVNLTIISTANNLASWGFNLTLKRTNGSITPIFKGTSSSASGGTITANINLTNTSNYDRLLISAYIQRTGESPYPFTRGDYVILTVTPGNSTFYGVMTQLRGLGFQNWQMMLIGAFISLGIATFLGTKGFGTYGLGLAFLVVFGFLAFFGFIDGTLFIVIAIASVAAYVIVRGGV